MKRHDGNPNATVFSKEQFDALRRAHDARTAEFLTVVDAGPPPWAVKALEDTGVTPEEINAVAHKLLGEKK